MVLPKLSVKLTELPISPSADAGHRPSARSGAGAEGQQTECGDQGIWIVSSSSGISFLFRSLGPSPRPNDRPHFTKRSPRMPQKSFSFHGLKGLFSPPCSRDAGPAASMLCARGLEPRRALSLFRSGYESDGPGAHTGSRGRAISWAIFSLAAPSRGRKGRGRSRSPPPQGPAGFHGVENAQLHRLPSTRRLMACCQR